MKFMKCINVSVCSICQLYYDSNNANRSSSTVDVVEDDEPLVLLLTPIDAFAFECELLLDALLRSEPFMSVLLVNGEDEEDDRPLIVEQIPEVETTVVATVFDETGDMRDELLLLLLALLLLLLLLLLLDCKL